MNPLILIPLQLSDEIEVVERNGLGGASSPPRI